MLVGVSGGPDSVALLGILSLIRKKRRLRLAVAHLNHGLRGTESDRDERFVRRLAEKFGAAFYSAKVAAAAFARVEGLSLEEACRVLRYRFFFKTARRIGAKKIATGHTLDDQAETVLMRILRGTALKGLAAIPVSRRQNGVTVIRPLLGIRKDALLRFLGRERLCFRTDASNADVRHLRNRIRAELMPLFAGRYNPQAAKNLVELAETSGKAHDYIAGRAAARFKRIARRSSGRLRLGIEGLLRSHPALRSEVYMMAAGKLAASDRPLAKLHLDAIEELLRAPEGARVPLAGALEVRRDARALVFGRRIDSASRRGYNKRV